MEKADEVNIETIENDETANMQDVPEKWNIKVLIITMLIMFVIQVMTLNCLCNEGSIKVEFALKFDLLVMIRVLFAMVFNERGNTWKFYLWLMIASPFWITILVSILKDRI